MNLCDDGHEEVCYSGRNCPACEAQKEVEKGDEIIADKDNEIELLRSQCADQIADYQAQIKTLEEQVERLEAKE